MKTRLQFHHLGILLLLAFSSSTASAAEILVHVVGQAKKPGAHKVESAITPQDLEKACGGWTEFGSAKRIQIVRLARPACPAIEDPGEEKSQVFELAEIPKEDGKILLKPNDIINVPMKIVYAR